MTLENRLFLEFCQTGDKKSFDELYERIKPWLSKMIFRLVPDFDAVYDIQQETWIKIFKSCSHFDPYKGKFNSYIFKTAKNEALNWKQKTVLRKHFEYEHKTVKDQNIELDTPEKMTIYKERNYMIKEAIKELSSNYQEVILLYYFADFEIKEIAEMIDTPEGTIKTRLDRARKELEKILPQYVNKDN